MAQEDGEASRAASRFPLPSGARRKAAVEKPANNGPGSGLGERTRSWALGGVRGGPADVGREGEVDRGEGGGEERGGRERGKDRQKENRDREEIRSEIQEMILEKAEEKN